MYVAPCRLADVVRTANDTGVSAAQVRLGATPGRDLHAPELGDGNDGWIDIVARRKLGSTNSDAGGALAAVGGGRKAPKGPWKPGPLSVVFRNSSMAT